MSPPPPSCRALGRYRRRARAAALAAAVVVALTAVLAAGSAARLTASPGSSSTSTTSTTFSGTPDATLVPVRLPASVPIGGEYVMRLHVNGHGAVSLRFTIHEPVTTLQRFVQIAQGSDLGDVIDSSISTTISTLTAAPHGDVIWSLPLQQPGDVRRSSTVRVLAPGVYPVELNLIGKYRTLDRVVTWLVATQGAATHPLQVAWVWSLRAAPFTQANGVVDHAVLDDALPLGHLDAITKSIATTASLPTTLRITPELVQSWKQRAATTDPKLGPGLARLAAAAADDRNQVLAEPFVDVNRGALVRAGLADSLTDPTGELVTGRNALLDTLGVRVDTRTAFIDRADSAVVDELTRNQADRLLVRPPTLAAIDSSLRFHSYSVPGSPIVAAQTDDDVLALLDGHAPPAERAQRFLAALSLIALQVPDETRGVVIAPGDHAINPVLLRLLVAGLTRHPLLEPVTLERWFDVVGPARDTLGQAITRAVQDESNPPSPPVNAARWRAARADLAVLQSLVGPSDARVQRAERALLVALARAGDRGVATAALDAIAGDARAFLGHISTQSRTVTLTARRSQIPLTFTNDTGRAVQIRVTLDSDKLLATDGSTRISKLIDLPARPRNTTSLFGVEARASGRFRVRVLLTSPDGSIAAGSPATITVNSTVFGAFGPWLTYGALAFLALWWARHLLRSRRHPEHDRASASR